MEHRLLLAQSEDQAVLEAARNRAEMLHRLVDGIQDGLFIVNGDMRIVFMNRATQRFFPPVTEPVGRQLIECVRDHRIVELVESRGEVRTSCTGGVPGVEPARWPHGGRPHLLRGDHPPERPLPAGLHQALLVIVRDETDKHMLEKIRKDFVANASHELRTPLSIINGYLENLTEGEIEGEPEILRAYTIMRKHGDRLAPHRRGSAGHQPHGIRRARGGEEGGIRFRRLCRRTSCTDSRRWRRPRRHG